MSPVLKTVLAAIGYILIVFPLAYFWHLGPLKEAYRTFGYFEDEPNIALGFLTIMIQGIVLSAMYPFFLPRTSGLVRALKFVAFVGVFFWTSHVLALVAKQDVPNATSFILLESGYLTLQFGLFGLCLAFLNRDNVNVVPDQYYS